VKKKQNRAKRKAAPSFKEKVDATAAQAGLRTLPVSALVATIDIMVGILRERGIEVRDWDEKEKVVQRVTIIGGKVYFLAPGGKQSEAKASGGTGDEKPN
jgi:Mor family transcriptional regulator